MAFFVTARTQLAGLVRLTFGTVVMGSAALASLRCGMRVDPSASLSAHALGITTRRTSQALKGLNCSSQGDL